MMAILKKIIAFLFGIGLMALGIYIFYQKLWADSRVWGGMIGYVAGLFAIVIFWLGLGLLISAFAIAQPTADKVPKDNTADTTPTKSEH